MKWFNRLAFRLWLAMNALILACILIFSYIYLTSQNKQLENALRTEGISAANTLGSAIGLYMLQENYEPISPLTYSLLSQPHVQYVIVRDNNGTIVNQKGETFTDRELIIEKIPLTYFQKKVGEIEIALQTDSLQAEKITLYRSTFWIALLSSLFSVLLSLIVSRLLTSPLKKLLAAVREMSKGQRNVTVAAEGTEEIQELSTAFNQMSATIANHEQILMDEIHKATASLSEKIAQLEVMSDISHAVIEQDLNREAVVRVILQRLMDFFQADLFSLFLYRKQGGQTVECYELWCDGDFTIRQTSLKDFPLKPYGPKEQPMCWKLSPDSHFTEERRLAEKGICSLWVQPLQAHNQSLGSLNMGSRQEESFACHHFQQLRLFSHPVTIALDRAAAYDSLRRSAYYDFLTGLPNYRSLQQQLHDALQERQQERSAAMRHDSFSPQLLALMFLDLDRFKAINDVLGHDFGDLLLKDVAQRLSARLKGRGTVFRMGGDEFIIVLPSLPDRKEAALVAEELLSEFHGSWHIEGYEIPVTASIGIALYPTDGVTANTLIKHADTAMYRVKSQGKNGYAFYTPTPGDPSIEQLILENDLRRALEKGEFVVFYQPKIDIQKGEVAGLEALVRWQHPEKGLLTPIEFIPLAEETGLIVPLGEYVLRTACQQNSTWLKKGFPPLCVSVNLSTRQFMQSNLVTLIRGILQESGLPPHLLELEITESMTLDVERAVAVLSELKSLGVKISIDDFGTGYSSLNYLQKLPLDRLKIDHSFVRDLTSNANNKALVSTIIAMAKHLALKVTAEGVESANQALFLQQNQCDEIQGYFFSRPLPAEELEKTFDSLQQTSKTWLNQEKKETAPDVQK